MYLIPLLPMISYIEDLHDRIDVEASGILSETLNETLASELARTIADDVSELFEFNTGIHYAIFDPVRGELAVTRVYKSAAEAEEAIKSIPDCHNRHFEVCTLLVEK